MCPMMYVAKGLYERVLRETNALDVTEFVNLSVEAVLDTLPPELRRDAPRPTSLREVLAARVTAAGGKRKQERSRKE